ncbi:MAG: hypothetical protein LUH07_04850, partial [Lachnospiraceae bacterium]|nr:hypothetical protein [Lachnospiraceae bacterium]
MEKGTFEYFQSGYERLNKLLNTYHKAMAESESLAAEEKHYKDFRTQMYDRYLSKYGAVQGGESKRYTEEELRQIRMELADTSFTTLLKRFFGIGKSTKESYFELVGKLNGLIRYLHEQAEMNIAKSEEAKEQFISTAKTYEAEYKKVKEETGSLPNSDWDNYQYAETSDGALLLGDVRQAFHKEVLTDFAVFQQAYKDNQLCLPYSWSVEKPLQMVCNYRKMSARQANQAVHSLILQMLRMSTEYYMEFHMMDGAMSGENFGELRNLQKARQQDIVYMNRRVTGGDFHLAKLSLDGSSISQDLAMLDRWMTVVAEELGEFKSLTEYNHAKGGEAWIPYQTVIIDNFPAGFESKDIDILNRMLTNGKTLGVFVILLNNVERWEEMNEKSTFSQESSIDTVLSKDALTAALTVDYTGEIPNIRLASSMFPCSLQLMRDDYSDYVKSIIKIVNQEKKLDNSFENLFDIEEPFGKLSTEVEKTAEDRGLHIPFAVTGRGEIMEYCLGEALNAHGLICGGTGSGKSTLLHMLISSIVMNYSPEDVEVWLADYKITEFTTYKINTPPHIRFIGLSKTPDFSYAFIDKITDEMTRRQNIIAEASHKYNQEGGKGSITNFKDYRKKNGIYSMRRLIVIIDEFHVMSQHAQAEPDYKLKLENILAEACTMGIIMLFSDQAIVDGLR